MAEIINLRRARKGKVREAAEAKAAENRARFGKTKAEREKEAALAERAAKALDGHKREDS
jgi:hypothetical protein